MAGEIIRQGDPTSHGGTVLEGSMTDICHGKPIAYVGHKVSCPQCKGTFPIIEGVLTTTFYGGGVAIANMKTACGAMLIPTQFTDTVEVGGGAAAGIDPALAKPAVAAAAALAAAADGAAGTPKAAEPDAAQSETAGKDLTKKVKAISWSYGKDEKPISGFSRFYVDLNLHVETENYSAGEMVDITVENSDGAELAEGVRQLTLKAAVGADGKAKLLNAFAGKTVITVPESETV